MTNDLFPPPTQPAPPPPGQTDQPPTLHRAKRRRTALWIGAGVGLVTLTSAITVAVMSMTRPAAPSAQPTVGPTFWSAEDVAEPTSPLPQPEITPVLADFELTPKILKKQCFGSAGCNVTFSVDMAYSGLPLSEDSTWLVTYEATGDESGPVIDTLELTGTKFLASEKRISTKSSNTKIALKVTSVDSQ